VRKLQSCSCHCMASSSILTRSAVSTSRFFPSLNLVGSGDAGTRTAEIHAEGRRGKEARRLSTRGWLQGELPLPLPVSSPAFTL
jgi:hypothetical protein